MPPAAAMGLDVVGERARVERRRPPRDDGADADADADAATKTIGRVHKQLSKRNAALYSCLCSIVEDAAFVSEVSLLYPTLPVVANLRAGLWYTSAAWREQRGREQRRRQQQQQQRQSDDDDARFAPPPTGLTAYFKSTDGHHGEWTFSTARLNWPLATLLADGGQGGGAILVDATRRGKRFPDALAKTVPCWCAVLNRAVALVRGSGSGEVHLPLAKTAARRAGSLTRQPSLGDWASAAAAATAAAGGGAASSSSGPAPSSGVGGSGLRSVASLNSWLDEELDPQQQHQHALPTLPPALSPLLEGGFSPFAGNGRGGGGGALQEPAAPAAAAKTKRRLPWWHADAEDEQQGDQDSDADDAEEDEDGEDDDDAGGQRDDDQTPRPRHHSGRGGGKSSTAKNPSPQEAGEDTDIRWDTALHLPPWIGRSEKAQIEARLESWTDSLMSAAGRPAVERLSSRLRKPLRPLWVCQGSRIFTDAVAQPQALPFTPLVLVSASDPRSGRRPLGPAHAAVMRRQRGGGGDSGDGGEREEDEENDADEEDDQDDDASATATTAATYEYLPGAGDDEESWARGLTPLLFWQYARELLSAGEGGAEAAARRVVGRLAAQRHHASERDARRAAAGAPGYAATSAAVSGGEGAAMAGGNNNENSNGKSSPDAPWPLGDDVPLLLGGLSAARLPEARRGATGCARAILLVGPSVHASLVPELERTRAQADCWLAAVGGESSFFFSQPSSCESDDKDAAIDGPPPSLPDILWLPVGGPKADRCSLTLALGPAVRFIAAHLSRGAEVLIADSDGASTCVCVAAAALQAMFGCCEEEDGEEGREEEEAEEEEGLIGRRVRLLPGVAEALASPSSSSSGGGLAAARGPSLKAPSRESVRRWVAFAASRYPPARPHRLAVKSVWAFFAAAGGCGGRRGKPQQQQQERFARRRGVTREEDL